MGRSDTDCREVAAAAPHEPGATARWLIAGSLVAITLFAYFPVHRYGFTNYDDGAYVTENRHVKGGLTWENIRWAFSAESSEAASNWHPLTWLSLMADVSLWGMNPSRMHVVNLLLHMVNVLLLFGLLVRITGNVWPSAFVAAVFAVHPLHVESVAWISERKDVLSTLFVLLAMLAHAQYVVSRRRVWLLAALGAYVFSLMTKQMYVTLPFLLLLLDWWPLRRLSVGEDNQKSRVPLRTLLVEKVPYLVVAVLFSVIAYVGQQRGGAIRGVEEHSVLQRVLNACNSYTAYLWKTVWPADLAVFYPYPKSLPWGTAIASLVFLVVLTALFVRVRRRQPYLLCGWLWYLGTLVPVLGLIQIGRQSMADRYMYFSQVGLAIALGWQGHDWATSKPAFRHIVTGASLIAVLVLTGAARVQSSYWRSSESLFAHAAEVAPSSLAYTKLGYELAQQGELTDAANHFHRALELDPGYVAALSSLGNTWLARGNPQQAIRYFTMVIQRDPEHAEAHYNLGIVHSWQGDHAAAIESFRTALRLDSDNPMIHANLGIALLALEEVPKAMQHLEQALVLDPQLPEAHFHIARILAAESRETEAIEHLKIVLQARPGAADVYKELAELYTRLGDTQQAEEYRRLAQ